MAADMKETQGQTKRKRVGKKLLHSEKVEVRSFDDGFLGSWHSATVIGCKNLLRLVQYDHLLSDNKPSKILSEYIKVTPIVDGVGTCEEGISDSYRGVIRPLPPPFVLKLWFLHYGQCVDFFYDDAWWEGVIFDHNDGCEKRRIFFPDMGDEIEGRVDKLRISHDWDESNEKWIPRRNWLFLEIIKEIEENWPLPVSVKQIWYELRVMSGFEILKEWTSSKRNIWRDLVLKVISDNLKVTLKHIFNELNIYPLLEFSEPLLDAVLENEDRIHNSLEVAPFKAKSQFKANEFLPTGENNTSHSQILEQNDQQVNFAPAKISSEQTLSDYTEALPILSYNPEEAFGDYDEQDPCKTLRSAYVDSRISTRKSNKAWQSAVPDFVTGPEFCPIAIAEINRSCTLRKWVPHEMLQNVRKHLLHLGWRIEYLIEKGQQKFRYFSPEGVTFYSLTKVCEHAGKDTRPASQILCITTPSKKNSSFVGSSRKNFVSSSVSKSQKTLRDLVVIEPEYCPEAVTNYLEWQGAGCNKTKTLKVKQHLSAIGWSFHYKQKADKREMRYNSPHGKTFNSLIEACRWCIKSGELTPANCVPHLKNSDNLLSVNGLNPPLIQVVFPEKDGELTLGDRKPIMGETENVNCLKDSVNESNPPLISVEASEKFPLVNVTFENESSEISKALVPSREVEIHKHKNFGKSHALTEVINADSSTFMDFDDLLSENGSNPPLISAESEEKFPLVNVPFETQLNESHEMSKALIPLTKVQKNRILGKRRKKSHELTKASKKTREIVLPSDRRLTILSWLIDNDVVLPRAKVSYRSKKDKRAMAEGQITREGIKCNCCQNIFSLTAFEAHAGSTNHRPSTNIFLEDGRSLHDCQLELNCKNIKRRSKPEQCETKENIRNKTNNDYMCSVCHFGGELVLCDMCPSAFHTQCLGLKEVPEGDWFCPSCRCGICGENGFDKRSKRFTDSSALTCAQCELQYHVGCLKTKGILKNRKSYPKGYWFCQHTCKQIFFGLRKILGKPFPVGTGLTWTLVKYVDFDSHNHNAFNSVYQMESHSKLNLALCVMHECFEPVKEPGSKRDLVEDVIFSRWSKLNRLNFQGFYTVLLEKNDELISAATVRIYGQKVAEVPLVGTRFQYRQRGMCRVLMNELEKKIKEMGVERLVLPAILSMVNTWTTSFGFSVMNESERLKFLRYTFLGFQGTVICQKVLNTVPSSLLSLSKVIGENNCEEDVKEKVKSAAELVRKSSISEVVSQAEDDPAVNHDEAYDIVVVEQGSAASCMEKSNNGVNSRGSTQTQTQTRPGITAGVVHDDDVDEDSNNDAILKC